MPITQTLAQQKPGIRRLSPPRVVRRPLRDLSIGRLLKGGRLSDAGRLPRYVAVTLMGSAAIWAPIMGYLNTAPLSFSSYASLILPGTGASSSVNINQIGQSSSYASSAFASNSVSPTETYKRLIGAERILETAAATLGLPREALGAPRVRLVDQTGLIHLEITGPTADDARARGDALLSAFFAELDALRADELEGRRNGGTAAIDDYRRAVNATRDDINALQATTGLHSAEQFDELIGANDTLSETLRARNDTLVQLTTSVAALEATLGIDAPQAAAALTLQADEEYLALVSEVAARAATLADLDARFGPAHPRVESERTAYVNARASADDRARAVTGLAPDAHVRLDQSATGARAELLADLVRNDVQRAGVRREVDHLTRRIAAEDQRLAALAPAASRLEDLQRDFAVAEAVFASAIARSESSRTDIYASYPMVQVLENPSLPNDPTSPRRAIAVAAGVGATMLMLFGLSLGWIRQAVINRLTRRRTA
jgi:uncharacterized protein involved in exopolysaccharide biosynthesis